MKTFAILSLLGLAVFSQAADFAADFSIANGNPNGGWTYGYTTTLGGTLNAFTNTRTASGLEQWYTPGLSSDFTPSAFKNVSSGAFQGMEPGAVALHPGPGGQFAVARYTLGASGVFSVVGMFEDGDLNNPGAGAVNLYVSHNGTSLFTSINTQHDQAFDLSVVGNLGDTIDFVVGTGNDGYGWDTTPLRATVNAVPEPASMAALGLGALGLLRRRRKG